MYCGRESPPSCMHFVSAIPCVRRPMLLGFVWVHVGSFLHCVASPFHSFVTTIPPISTAAMHPSAQQSTTHPYYPHPTGSSPDPLSQRSRCEAQAGRAALHRRLTGLSGDPCPRDPCPGTATPPSLSTRLEAQACCCDLSQCVHADLSNRLSHAVSPVGAVTTACAHPICIPK